jgi:hypothetical protein
VVRQLLVHTPTLETLPRGGDDRFDYQLAVIAALNEPSIAANAATWLHEMGRHESGVFDLLDRAEPQQAPVALALAVSYARYWDWIGHQQRLRAEFARALDTTDGDPHGSGGLVAEAAGWLAYSFGTGRVLAVESIIARRRDPEDALRHGEAGARLLGIHGTVEETAYAHVASALAALDADPSNAAEWHAQQADDLYRQLGDRRGLAWLDVILARIHGTVAEDAPDFSADYDEHTIPTMLREQSGRARP